MALAMMTPISAYAQIDSSGGIRGDSFMRGMKNPSELADLIETHLKTDPAGQKLLDPKKCHQAVQKSCGSAWAYLMMFRIDDPKSKELGLLDRVDQLPAYLRSLTPDNVANDDEEWWMACMVPVGEDVFNPVGLCMSRPLNKGEPVWKSPTGADVLAGDCTNPLFGKNTPFVATENCGKVEVPLPANTVEEHHQLAGPTKIGDSVCFHAHQWDECKTVCSFSEEEQRYILRTRELYHVDLVIADRKIAGYVSSPTPHASTMTVFLPSYVAKGGYAFSVCIDVVDPKTGIIHRSVPTTIVWPGPTSRRQWDFPDFQMFD